MLPLSPQLCQGATGYFGLLRGIGHQKVGHAKKLTTLELSMPPTSLAPADCRLISAAAQTRTQLVHDWQRYYGMTPRSDSRLTELFAAGKTNLSASEVARELLATDFIYKHTLYGELIEDFMRSVANMLRAKFPSLSWTATWTITRFYAPIALKLMCLSSTGSRIPNVAI